eukprot:scaffold7428_cov120-Isochrysis_galbana.AAC.2
MLQPRAFCLEWLPAHCRAAASVRLRGGGVSRCCMACARPAWLPPHPLSVPSVQRAGCKLQAAHPGKVFGTPAYRRCKNIFEGGLAYSPTLSNPDALFPVASAVFLHLHSFFFLSLDSAKDRPITDTDVQSDGRPLALPGDSHGVLHLRDDLAAARRATFVMIISYGNSGSTTTTTHVLPRRARARVPPGQGQRLHEGHLAQYHTKHMCRLGVCPNYLSYSRCGADSAPRHNHTPTDALLTLRSKCMWPSAIGGLQATWSRRPGLARPSLF